MGKPKNAADLDVTAWQKVATRVDQFFSKVESQHAEKLACRIACTSCCHPDLTLTFIEAAIVGVAVDGLPSTDRAAVAKAAEEGSPLCPLLLNSRCSIYESRPVICRSHGLPIRQDDQVSSCELNFLNGFPEDAILNAGLLSVWLMVADGMARKGHGVGAEQRYAIRDLARLGASLFERELPISQDVES
jgi:uncharacterized protein